MRMLAMSAHAKSLLALICMILTAVLMVSLIVVVAILKNSKYSRQSKLNYFKSKYQEYVEDINNTINPYLSKLNTNSSTNLLYASIFDELSPIYHKVITNYEPAVSVAIDSLEANIREKHKIYHKKLIDVKTVFTVFEKNVSKLKSKLVDLFKTEEVLKDQMAKLSASYDECRKSYEDNEENLDILSDTFFRIFDGIEEDMQLFDEVVMNSEYEKGKEIIKRMTLAINELKIGLEKLPSLCIDASKTLPSLLEQVESQAFKMKEDKIPVHHLHVSSMLNAYHSNLTTLINDMKNFEYRNTRSQFDEMIDGLQSLLRSFEKEYESATFVESDCKNIYTDCNNIEKVFISLKRRVNDVKVYYIINSTYADYIDNIQARINDLTTIKRQLDSYVLSSTKQPYSMLYGKMQELETQCNEVKKMINEYNNYIDTLRIDCDNSYALINETYLIVKHNEYLLRELNLPNISSSQKETTSRIYTLLDRLNKCLITTPIDVTTVNRYANEIKTLTNALVSFVETTIKQVSTIETNVVLSNVQRCSLTSFNVMLTSVEKEFFNGEFVKSIELSNEVLNKSKVN